MSTPRPGVLTRGVLTRRELPATSLETREADDTGREVAGIGVPYGVTIDLAPRVRERFAPGAVETDPEDGPLLFWRHSAPIGRVIHAEQRPAGWFHRSRISDTDAGREAHTLARDGVIRAFSVGFEPLEWTEQLDADGTLTITHTRARVREVSLVPLPAYAGALVAEVRSQDTTAERTDPMPDPMTTTTEQLTDLRERIGELTRRVETTAAAGPAPGPTHPALAFRSMGEYVKAAAAGDDRALELHKLATRAITTAAVDVPSDSWVGNLIDQMTERQPVASSFVKKSDLPAEGMGVEFWQMGDDTTAVTEQATEATDLAYGELDVTSDRAPVRTLGGWTRLSRQAIERTPVAMLDAVFTALALKYARAVEIAARAVFTTAHTAALAGTADKLTLRAALATADASDWLAAVLDIAEAFDGRGRTLSGLKVSRDVFAALADVPATDRMLVVSNAPAGSNGGGTLNVSVPEANLYGISVELVPNWTGANAAAYDRLAIRTQEAPGAPLRLQDDNVVNLTRAFSVYGYVATYLQVPGGIVALDTAGPV